MDKTKEQLFKAIEIIAKKMPTPFDQSKYGRVVGIPSPNTYKVQVQDSFHTIKSKFDFSIGERVLVLFPQGRNVDLYLYPNK